MDCNKVYYCNVLEKLVRCIPIEEWMTEAKKEPNRAFRLQTHGNL